MRLPDMVGVARKWMLAGGVALLVGLALVSPRLADEPADPAIDHSLTLPAPVTTTGADAAADVPSGPDPARGRPARVSIPGIGVDASVEGIGLGEGGLLVPPADQRRVGWWNGGAEPGSPRGAVVLAGHTVRLGDGVFDDLPALHEGDRVEVTTERGVVTYRVDEVAALDKEELARVSTRLFSRTGTARLVLITCGDYAHGEYHGNVVVTALPEPGRARE